ncbi:four-helix bundle copper-binding protein [Bacillus sp. MMSF_3328]|uniref:four-helix bundle copper-binding protein n=1 Tax=Bacillus sp. MMSF_3328 TaxID=3047080 RepID=UPI00273D9405|nr:four-helix bundle copper-binding protein [Bacillus sp. MMSF_3328]
MDNSYENCIKACLDCLEACEVSFKKTLKEADAGKKSEAIRLYRDSADICALTIKALESDSDFIKKYTLLCSRIVDQCAEQCKQFEQAHCMNSAEKCYICAEECRKLAA